MKGKIVKGKTLKEWEKKYGNKDTKDKLEIITAKAADQDPSKLDNKKWWLIDNKYYQVPKKKWLIPLFCILGAGVITGGIVTPLVLLKNNGTEITISIPHTLNIQSGKTSTLTATVNPKDTPITWSSDRQDIATVSGTGSTVTITGVAEGTAHITAKAGDKTDTCTVNVTASANATITWTKSSESGQTLSYSTDGVNYTSITDTTEITYPTTGDKKLYLKGTLKNNSSSNNNIKIECPTNDIILCGDLKLLLGDSVTTLSGYDFKKMFEDSTGIKSLDDTAVNSLNFNTLETYCYEGMFRGCTNLTNIPFLPATTLATYCYSRMFENCKKLVNLPSGFALNAAEAKESCYSGMFAGCSELTTIPLLPATTLANSCYYDMFDNCESLTTLPENFKLSCTTLVYGCYAAMFTGCTKLREAPNLPATELANTCYNQMFNNCLLLEKTPDMAPTKVDQGSCNSMFANCQKIQLSDNFSLPATDIGDSCYNSMFSGCTSLTSAPNLPATELKPGCYYQMFSGCTSLEKTPLISATTLADLTPGAPFVGCCQQMFSGCTKIQICDGFELSSTVLTKNCYYQMFLGCSSLSKMGKIKATSLSDWSCSLMFANCSNLYIQEKGTAPASGGEVFTCPTTGVLENPVYGMFGGCPGFTAGTPTAGNTYYWYPKP